MVGVTVPPGEWCRGEALSYALPGPPSSLSYTSVYRVLSIPNILAWEGFGDYGRREGGGEGYTLLLALGAPFFCYS